MNTQECNDACVRHAAVQSAERGWYVFPTRPDGKEPREGLSWPAAATGDPAMVSRAGWRPGENYGVAAKLSGLVIIDLDMPKVGYDFPTAWQAERGIRDGKDILATLAERARHPWPSTFTVQTPSGGWHLYYLAPAGRLIGNRPLGPLVDVRGGGDSHGGYVLGPGSVLGGRRYEIIDTDGPKQLPAWLTDLLDPPQTERSALRLRSSSVVPNHSDAYTRMRGVLDRLSGARPGDGRNALLHWSACRFAEMIAAGEIDSVTAESALYLAAEENGHVAKHGERATRATIASGMSRGVAA